MIFTAKRTNAHFTSSSISAVIRPPRIAAPQLTLARGSSLFISVSARTWISIGAMKRDTPLDSISLPDQYSENAASVGSSVTIA